MSQKKSDNFLINAGKQLDDKMGIGSGAEWRPYDTVTEFTTRFPVIGRAEGQLFWVRNLIDTDKADLYSLRKTNKEPYMVLGDVDLSPTLPTPSDETFIII